MNMVEEISNVKERPKKGGVGLQEHLKLAEHHHRRAIAAHEEVMRQHQGPSTAESHEKAHNAHKEVLMHHAHVIHHLTEAKKLGGTHR